MKYDVLVTDAEQRVALEIVRSLGISGLKIVTVELKKNSSKPLTAASRYSNSFQAVSSYESDDFFELCKISRVVIPVSTNTIITCRTKLYEKFPEKLLLPDKTLFNEVNDKYLLSLKAEKSGIRIPKTVILSEKSDFKSEAEKSGYPLVLKLQNDKGLYLSPAERYRIVHSPLKLEKAWKELIRHGKELLMQEYVAGYGVGFSAVYDENHKCAASFQHKRLREYPIEGGPSTYCESIFKELIDTEGRKLLDELKWTGPAMVEFKYNESSDKLYLLEINPRYWGSLPLARHSGLNLPLIHYNILTGKENTLEKDYIKGIKVKFFITDFLAAMKEISRKKRYILQTMHYLKEFFDLKLKWGLWMLRDPLPSIRYLINHLR